MTDRCEHPEFASRVAIGRLMDVEGGPVTHYTAEIRVACATCKMPFEWVGPPLGILDPNAPVVSIDRQELRIPIEPLRTTMRGRVGVGLTIERRVRTDA